MRTLYRVICGLFVLGLTGAALAEAPTQAIPIRKQSVILDRIEIAGRTTMTPSQLEQYLGLQLGEEIELTVAAERLSETANLLNATGRFERDVQLRLERGLSFPHYIVKAQMDDARSTYLGLIGSYAYCTTCSGFGSGYAAVGESKFHDRRAGVYWGDRALSGKQWALDIDLTLYDMRGTISEREASSGYDHQATLQIVDSRLTLLNRDIFGGRGYTGASIELLSMDIEYEYRYFFAYQDDRYDGLYIDDTRSWALSGESFAGLKFGKAALGGGVARAVSRVFRARHSHEQSKNGQPDREFSYGRYVGDLEFTTTGRISIGYSDKTRLSLVEPGIDASISWTRTYLDTYTSDPDVTAVAEYSFLSTKNAAITLLSSGKWAYDDSYDYHRYSVARTIELGGRWDYVYQGQYVIYAEFTRFGGKKLELSGDEVDGESLVLRSHAEFGVKKASTGMTYNLSFIYGQRRPPDQAYFSGLQPQTNLARLGVQ